MLAQQNHLIAEVGRPQQMRPRPRISPQTAAENERIRKEIVSAGYGDAIEPDDKVWFDNRHISFKQWAIENGRI
jgi:hypothetical protein